MSQREPGKESDASRPSARYGNIDVPVSRQQSELGQMPYTYHQSHKQITVLCDVPWNVESSDIELQLSSDSIVAGVKGAVPLLKGKLVAPIVPAASTFYLERRPGEPKSRRAATRSSTTQSSSSESNGDECQASGNSPSGHPPSPGSASSFDHIGHAQSAPSSLASFDTGVDSGRRGPASESSSFGSAAGGAWVASGGTSDEGELVGHSTSDQPSSPSASHLSHSGYLSIERESDGGSSPIPPPSLEASSILQSSSEDSAPTFLSASTGSAPPSLSSAESPHASEVPTAHPPTRLLTLYLVKKMPRIWEHLVIVGGIDGREVAPGVPDCDSTSLAALASELVTKGYDARERAFTILLHVHNTDHLPLASHQLLLHFFPPPILTPTGEEDPAITPSHIFRLGGTHELARFYLHFSRIYLVGPMPPPPPQYRPSSGPVTQRLSAGRQLEIAKALLTRALLANPRLTIDDPDIKDLAKEMGFRRSKNGQWRQMPFKSRRKGEHRDASSSLLRTQGLYLVGGAVFAGAVALGVALWWRRRAASGILPPSWRVTPATSASLET